VSVLEFIASLKWPITVLVALFVVTRAFTSDPGKGQALADWLNKRNVRANIGGQELEFTMAGTEDAAATVTAPDEQLAASIAGSTEPGTGSGIAVPTDEAVVQMRREAAEELMRNAARWGWDAAQMGFTTPPVPQIDWQGDRPVIRFGIGARTSQMARNLAHTVFQNMKDNPELAQRLEALLASSRRGNTQQ
jgi:hypothetical protein